MLPVLAIAQVAIGLAGLFGPKGGAAAMQRAQIDMLRAMQSQLVAIGDGIVALQEQVTELKELIVDLPDDTVDALRNSEVRQAQQALIAWAAAYERRVKDYGIERADDDLGMFADLKNKVMDKAEGAFLSLNNEFDHGQIPIMSLAAYLDLTARVHFYSVSTSEDVFRERMLNRAASAKTYAAWFDAVLGATGDASLAGVVDKRREEREALGDLDKVVALSELAIVSAEDYKMTAAWPWQMKPVFTGESHQAETSRMASATVVVSQEYSRRRYWDLFFDDSENGLLSQSATTLIEEGYLSTSDLPRARRSVLAHAGLQFTSLLVTEGPLAGIPYGGPTALPMAYAAGQTVDALRAKDQADVDATTLCERTGQQLLSLAALQKLAVDSKHWLDEVHATSLEVAGA